MMANHAYIGEGIRCEYVDPDGRADALRRTGNIIRCRDCKRTAPYGNGIECLGPLVQTWDYHNDRPIHNPVGFDDYCAWGERGEE